MVEMADLERHANLRVLQEYIEKAASLLPTKNILLAVDEGVTAVVSHLKEKQPQEIITLGRSSVLSRILLHRGLKQELPRFSLTRMDGQANQLLYKTFFNEEVTEKERMRRLKLLFVKKYQKLKRNKKIIIVDEFIDSGGKAIEVLQKFHELEFTDVGWASFTATQGVYFKDPAYLASLLEKHSHFKKFHRNLSNVLNGETPIDVTESIFIGSYNPIAHAYLKSVADVISVTKVLVYERQSDQVLARKLVTLVKKILLAIAR